MAGLALTTRSLRVAGPSLLKRKVRGNGRSCFNETIFESCRSLPFEREGSGGISSFIRKELTEAAIFILDRCG